MVEEQSVFVQTVIQVHQGKISNPQALLVNTVD